MMQLTIQSADGGSIPPPSLQLAKLDAARADLRETTSLLDVKKIKAVADAVRIAQVSSETRNYAAESALLAIIRAGEILKQLTRNTSSGVPASVAGTSEYAQLSKTPILPATAVQRGRRVSKKSRRSAEPAAGTSNGICSVRVGRLAAAESHPHAHGENSASGSGIEPGPYPARPPEVQGTTWREQRAKGARADGSRAWFQPPSERGELRLRRAARPGVPLPLGSK